MKAIYDADTDTLTMVLREEPIAESDELREGIVVDYGHDGKIVSIEILKASVEVGDAQSILYEGRTAGAG